MSYALLIFEPQGQRETRTPEQAQSAYERMLQFGSGLKEQGLLLGGESLKADHDAVRLQVREGKQRLLDGPFSEAKEMIGGFFLLDTEDRQQALAIAARCPAAEWATVEVREVGPCVN